MPTVLHIASVFPSNSNRLALQVKYAHGAWDVHVLNIRATPDLVDKHDQEQYRTSVLPHIPRHRPGHPWLLRRFRSLIRRIVNTIALCAMLVRDKADIMHAHQHSSLWPLAFWVLVLQRKALWDPHDFFYGTNVGKTRSPSLLIKRFLERKIMDAGVPMVVVSNGMLNEYENLYPKSAIRLIKNYSSDRYPRVGRSMDSAETLVRFRNRWQNKEVRLVYPGLIKPERLNMELVREIGSLDSVTLDIYGEDRTGSGSYKTSLLRMLEEDEIDNVRIRGSYSSETVVRILRSYHFALLPYEINHPNIDFCLPNKFYQCIEAGLPLISTTMKELGTIITVFGLGFVFPPGAHTSIKTILSGCSTSNTDYLSLVSNVLRYKSDEIDYEAQRVSLMESYHIAADRT